MVKILLLDRKWITILVVGLFIAIISPRGCLMAVSPWMFSETLIIPTVVFSLFSLSLVVCHHAVVSWHVGCLCFWCCNLPILS